MAGGDENCYSYFGKQFGSVLRNIVLPYDPVVQLLGIYQEKQNQTSTQRLPQMLPAVMLIIATNCNPPKCPSAGKSINKIWHIHTKGQEKDELLIYATRMNLKITVLNERSQAQQSICCIIPFIQNSKQCKLVCSDSKAVVTWTQAWREDSLRRGARRLLEVRKYSILIVAVVSQMCNLSKLIEL